MGWDILLFDLDGTLTDSGPGIMHAAKTALQSFGIDGLSEQELRYFVGPPLWESFGKYLPEAASPVSDIYGTLSTPRSALNRWILLSPIRLKPSDFPIGQPT